MKPLENIVNPEIVRGRIIAMAEYSDSDYVPEDYVPEIKSTVYGVDSAIVLVVLASAALWLAIGAVVWLFIG